MTQNLRQFEAATDNDDQRPQTANVDQTELEFKMQFSERVSGLLAQKGYPPKGQGRDIRLANEMRDAGEEVSASTVYKWLNGNVPGPFYLKKLALVLGTTVDYLVGLTDASDLLTPSNMSQPKMRALWRPISADHSSIPAAPASAGQVELYGFWAERQTPSRVWVKEHVVYDRRDVLLTDGLTYVLVLDGELYLRRVERVGPYMLRLWNDDPSIFFQAEMDDFAEEKNNRILGRVLWRNTLA